MWWLDLSIKDAVDILLLATFFFYTYYALKRSGSKALFMGFISFLGVWILISRILEMQLMGAILDRFVNIGFIILVIIFQDEIKKFLVAIGSGTRWRSFTRLFRDKQVEQADKTRYVAPVVLACMNMAKKKTGALIAIQGASDLSRYQFAGERFNADVNARLIENIFFKNSPLHDGAMIIAGNKIRAAGCILPVANDPELNKDLGLRHRSALGLSQETDAKVIIVSEERGSISLAYQGEVMVDISAEQLQEMLMH